MCLLIVWDNRQLSVLRTHEKLSALRTGIRTFSSCDRLTLIFPFVFRENSCDLLKVLKYPWLKIPLSEPQQGSTQSLLVNGLLKPPSFAKCRMAPWRYIPAGCGGIPQEYPSPTLRAAKGANSTLRFDGAYRLARSAQRGRCLSIASANC